MSEFKKGKPLLLETRRKMSIAHLGRLVSEETRKKIGKANWKGGLTPINKAIRSSDKYRLWRIAVFERDNYTCIECGLRGVHLNADHIKPFAYFPELRLNLDNGRTLCINCHSKTDTYKGKAINYKKIYG